HFREVAISMFYDFHIGKKEGFLEPFMLVRTILVCGILGLTACATETPEQESAHVERIQHENYVSDADQNYYYNSRIKKQKSKIFDYYESHCPTIQDQDEQWACWSEAKKFWATYSPMPDHVPHPDPFVDDVMHDQDITNERRMFEFYHRLDNLGIGY
ncbi:hypothetical protein, partial [Acetobacter pomorum]